MEVIVNGNSKECPRETTLSMLIESLGLKVEVMAAAVNMEIVKKDAWESHLLNENDRIELLHFVGGG
jgi:sulfur carrier protein